MKLKIMGRLATLALAGVLVASCGEDNVKQTSEKAASPTKMKIVKGGFNSVQQQQIKQLVRNTLLENPEILQEAFAALEKKEKLAQEKKKTEALASSADILFRSKLSPVGGNPNGDVTVVEFFDYNCPYCRKAYNAIDKVVTDDKKVKVVFKEFPIFGGASRLAAKAALAAGKQGKYYEFHQALFLQKGRVTKGVVFKKAADLGLDIERLKKDMESDEVAASIRETRSLADSLGIRGTPAIFIGDKLVPGAPENLADLIKAKVKDIRKNGCKNC